MKKYWIWYIRILLLSIFINIIIESIGRKSAAGGFIYLAEQPVIFAINLLIIIQPFMIVFITKRKIFACTVISFLWLAVGALNGILLTFRTTPFTAADFRLVKYALGMVTSYLNWFQIILAVSALIVAVVLCFALWKYIPAEKEDISYKSALITAAVSTAVILCAVNTGMYTGTVATNFGNIGQAYKDYGIPYCFSNSIFNTGISKPEQYNEEVLVSIENEELVPENSYELSDKKPNIIMIQLESFFDPMLWKKRPVKGDYIPFFRYLYRTYPSGYLSVPSVGAGTANTEFEIITGMNLDFFGPGEYPYKTVLNKTVCESAAFDLKELGYTAHAIHNNEATFYDRHHVFSQLGFDTFTPIEYMNDVERNPTGWCKDRILTKEIVSALDSTEGSDYIYTISVQGHGAYPDFEYYCGQISEMDNFIKELVSILNGRKEPSVLVLYGDHLPGFEWQAEDMENNTLFQTQYVIWNNVKMEKETRDVEAYQLTPYVLSKLGIHEGTMMRYHQKYLKKCEDNKPSEEENTRYLEDMKILEYDILYGKREIYDRAKPYKATKLQMGINKIDIDSVSESEDSVLVFGDNFTPYSYICIDGKPVETMYVWPELLIAKGIYDENERGGDEEITVKQIGRDKVVLGEYR